MWKRIRRSCNCLQSFYERHGRARTERVLQNFEPAQIPITRSDNVLNVLKTRRTYHERNCSTSIVLGTSYNVVQSVINSWSMVRWMCVLTSRTSDSVQIRPKLMKMRSALTGRHVMGPIDSKIVPRHWGNAVQKCNTIYACFKLNKNRMTFLFSITQHTTKNIQLNNDHSNLFVTFKTST